MTPKQGLLLQDEKILTAKRLAFRNLWRLDRDLFVRDDHSEMKDVHQVCLQQVSIISVMQQTKENSVSLAEFLIGLPSYFERVLRNSFPPEKQAKLDMFLAHLGLEANQCVSIIDDCNCWLARLREHGADYLIRNVDVAVSIPATPLCFDVDDRPMLDAAGGKTTQQGDWAERIVELCFDPKEFSIRSYFSALCVLSHEFWCHSLSRLRVHPEIPAAAPQESWGCDPGDLWEEGWMDFVQSLILEWEIDGIVNDPMYVAAFFDNCGRFASSRNDPSCGHARSFGYRTAQHFYQFLRHSFRQTDHFACLVLLSLELNTIDCSSDLKKDFVAKVSECFNLDLAPTGTPQSMDELEQHLLRQKDSLFKVLEAAGAGRARINLLDLLRRMELIA